MKIDEIELERVCRHAGLRKITTAKVPKYATQDGSEGIELQRVHTSNEGYYDTLVSFHYTDGERIEGKPPGKQIAMVLGAFEEKEQPKIPQVIQEDKATIPQSEARGAVLIPETLTMPLLEKWKKMTTFERMLMFQKTDSSNIEERNGFKKPDGSFEKLKYVTGNFMLQEANIAFLFAWSSKIDNISIGQTAVAVYGSISVEIDGKMITRSCVGVDEINSKVTAQHAIKNAATDMIKKGLASLGFNGDVYRGEV